MANAATPTIVPTTGNSVDREKMSVQTIGFPPTEDTASAEMMSAETLAKSALPVLARVPRLEIGGQIEIGEQKRVEPEVVADLEIETPGLDEARKYRVDSLPAPTLQLHQPEEQLPPQRLDQPHDDLESSVEDEAPAIVTSSPLRTLRQLELTSAEDRISAYLLRLQIMLKPLARIILLAALLTASALAYLLLEDNHVPLAPLNQQMVPTPNRPAEPRLTRRPTSTGPNSKPISSPVLRPRRPLSAIGPGGKHVTANKVAARSATSANTESLPKPPPLPTIERAPAINRITQTPNVPVSYPNTGHPDVTPLQRMSLPAVATRTATPVKQTNKQAGRPVAVAELTGSIQTPIKR